MVKELRTENRKSVLDTFSSSALAFGGPQKKAFSVTNRKNSHGR